MNKQEILALLGPFIVESFHLEENLDLQDIHWRLEDSRTDQVVFYKIPAHQRGAGEFEKRLENAQYGLLLVNRIPELNTLPANLMVVEDHEFLACQKILLDRFYPLDLGKKKLVGVTGTNGKSTTVDLARQISDQMGHTAFGLGTLGIKSARGEFKTQSGLTTPPLIELHKLLHRLFKDHDAGFMEVSSHALSYERIFGLKFDAIAWTSFGQDHLDYHQDMESYFQAKKRLYTHHLKKGGPFIIPQREKDLIGRLEGCGPKATRPLFERQVGSLPLFLATEFNQNNLEVALEINEALWQKVAEIDYGKLAPLEGRFTLWRIGKNIFIVDFAHTPDALRSVGQSIKEVFPDKKLIILFGCGGDRDPHKRPLMGEVADQVGDKICLTSDNPRSEDPREIISHIEKGITQKTPMVIVEREEAIRTCYREMKGGEVLLIAGKGHESYQIIGDSVLDYSDERVLQQIASEVGMELEKIHGRY